MSRADKTEILTIPNAVTGDMRWDPAMSIWNSTMLVAAVVLGPITLTPAAVLVGLGLGGITLMAGLSVGLHRLLAHEAFECGPPTRRFLAWLGVLVGLGGPIGMVRSHHLSDWAQHRAQAHPFFTHGRWTLTHLIWRMHGRIALAQPPSFDLDMLERDRFLVFLERTWMLQQLPLAALLWGLGGLPFVVWGIFVRVAVSTTGYWLIAHLAHRPDKEQVSGEVHGNDVAWAGWVSMGEAWHSNHHAFPSSAKIGLYPGQSDWGFRFIQALERLGLAWNVRTPETMAGRQRALRVVR